MVGLFRGAIITLLVGLGLSWLVGGWPALWLTLNLALLETSLSFDNAVINAATLRNWDSRWRQRYLLWGMPVAVFGMRILFPLLVVACGTGLWPLPGLGAVHAWLASGYWPVNDVLSLAIAAPEQYATILHSAHTELSAFGGTFLLLVFWHFFIDHEKQEHWFAPLERTLSRLGKLDMAPILLTLVILIVLSAAMPADGHRFLVAGAWGMVAYIAVDGLGALLGDDNAAGKLGWSGFIYVEVRDASFSFDGVLGALALTHNIFLIAIGLGIGAMFVRSFTLCLVERDTLASLRYLEHGAFWAIGALAGIMLLSPWTHIPDALTGGLAAALIVLAGGHSWWLRRTLPQTE